MSITARPHLVSTMIVNAWDAAAAPGVILTGTQVACDPHCNLLGKARLQEVLLQCSFAFNGLRHSLQCGYEVCRMILPDPVLTHAIVAHCAGQCI